jgi:hypothetical protein
MRSYLLPQLLDRRSGGICAQRFQEGQIGWHALSLRGPTAQHDHARSQLGA